jgi:secreted trypsin-like serine protease
MVKFLSFEVLAIVLLLSGIGCVRVGDRTVEPGQIAAGIVGGEPATPEFAKSVVAIYLPGSWTNCTGTLITPHVVLTAAHCLVSDLRGAKIFLGVELHNSREPVITVKASSAVLHPRFGRQEGMVVNDIALLYFETDLPDGFAPVALPSKSDIVSATDLVDVVGYGITDPEKQDSGKMRMVSRQGVVASPDLLDFRVDVTDGHGTCDGDSGGPVLVRKGGNLTVVGVASSILYPKIDTTTKCRYRSVFTNVIHYLDWIDEAMKLFPQAGL